MERPCEPLFHVLMMQYHPLAYRRLDEYRV